MNREDVVIITKCGVTWDQEMKGDLFNKVNGIQLYKNLNSASVKKEIEGSLERLGTDYIDVYMTHWQSVEGSEYYVPIQKTMEVLNNLKAQGKIRAIGAANVDIHHIQELSHAAVKTGLLYKPILHWKWGFCPGLFPGIINRLEHKSRKNGSSLKICRPLWI